MNIILFGFQGSGKTHFAQLLARDLKKTFIDTDDLIVKRTNSSQSIRELYQALGEEPFRLLENDAIQSLTPDLDAVIALGGGAILNPRNIELLKTIGKLVYLHAGFDQIQKRILEKGIPSFVNKEHSLRKIYDERLPIYESITARRIDTDRLDEGEILATLKEFAYGL